MKIVLRLGQHAARAAGGVEELAHSAGRGEKFVVVDEQQIDHEADDFARREVIPGGFIGKFVETADEIFKHQSHFDVVHAVGMQIDVAKFGDDEIKDVRLAHPLDFAVELEKLEDAADVGRKAFDVAGEMLVDVVRVALEIFEIER